MNEILIKECEPLIRSIAKKFYNIDENDLYQVGVIGLINAYKHYKNNSATKFSTYAYQYIFGEMYNLALETKLIKTNKDILKLTKLVEKAKVILTQTMSKEPTLEDISAYLEIPLETIQSAINLTPTILSLDEPTNTTDLYNAIPDKPKTIDLKLDLTSSMAKLTTEEQNIINCRYFNDLTQQETAKKLGLSQVKVSRCEKLCLTKMYNYLNS